jgi:HEAT repeat protein
MLGPDKRVDRNLRRWMAGRLSHPDFFGRGMADIGALPERRAFNALLPFFFDRDETAKWRAVCAAGVVVGTLAEKDLESARDLVRRLIWNLNDESGGIGWGSPEAMGEILARQPLLAIEYASLFVSFLLEDENRLENRLLLAGALWGAGRLARANPAAIRDANRFLPPLFAAGMPLLRGLAAWAAGPLMTETIRPLLRPLLSDPSPVRFFPDCRPVDTTVSRLAEEALSDRKEAQTR